MSFLVCRTDEHRCGCQVRGPSECRTTLAHACVCTNTADVHACRSNSHCCVCPLTEVRRSSYPYIAVAYAWNVNCRAITHRCECYCSSRDKKACCTRNAHLCICEAGADCFAAQHECVCIAIGASKCKAPAKRHPCLCVMRGPANCIFESHPLNSCPCTCTTAKDNSACRTVNHHKCTCRCIISGTALPSIDSSVCRVPPDGVHTYYTVAFCPPYTK